VAPLAAGVSVPNPESRPQAPTFRSGVDLVTVDVTVVDGTGVPIEGLAADDFELSVDSQARPIVSAQFVSHAFTASSSRDLAAAHYSSNEHVTTGRLVLFVVDQEHMRPLEGRAALRAAAGFIDSLHPGDRVGATGLPSTGRVIELTTNHGIVQRELERLVGQATPPPVYFDIGLLEALEISEGSRAYLNDVVQRECGTTLGRSENPARTADNEAGRDPCPIQVEQEARALAQYVRNQSRMSLAGVRGLIERMKNVEGPKTIILLSEGLVAEPRFVDMADLAAAAHASRVTIHVLQPEVSLLDASLSRPSPTLLRDRQLREDGLARLAGAGRGGLFHLVGGGEPVFERIARELSGYYLLAFQATETDRDDRVHRIDVKLRHRRATLRGREAFTLATQPPKGSTIEDRLAALLRAPNLAAELPLRVATYTYQEPGTEKVRVVVSAETDAATDEVSTPTLAFVLLDERNVVAATATHPALAGAYAFSALVVPGDYRVKVAATDALGRLGSVERPFGARIVQAGKVRVSDLMVAEVPDRPEESLHPVVARAFDQRLLAYLELYADDGTALRETRVRMEVSETEAGPTLLTVPATLQRRDARWSIARAVLPIGPLPAGRYFARAEVMVGGETARRIARPFTVARASSK
jgi:VWFA-related protein